ncbi:hypothetical protein AMJ50_02565 [Parcubacteria bacterium DG_74_3]|nr:MAG: hypothetical protein AMJ50_02565 [Parcubacteria bacterium DG_74_3]
MSKREKFFKGLREGIPADAVSMQIRKIQREEAIEKTPKENPYRFEDKRAQHFSDLWFSQRKTATVKQKDKVGLAFISKVLGLGDEIAQGFARGDREAHLAVGERQSALPTNIDLSDFWQEAKEIFPNTYTNEDMAFLAKKGGIDAVLCFLWQLEVPLAEESPILRSLSINAHIYK